MLPGISLAFKSKTAHFNLISAGGQPREYVMEIIYGIQTGLSLLVAASIIIIGAILGFLAEGIDLLVEALTKEAREWVS